MYSSIVFLLAGVSSALAASLSSGQYEANMALKNLFERQTRICTPVQNPTCERSCGPGFITCVSFPTCYNPGRGDTCCSNGKYCPKGYYCTNAGCCPVGTPLADCGATQTLSIILPGAPATSASVESPTVSPTPSAPATSYSSENAASSSASAAAVVETTTTAVAVVTTTTAVVGSTAPMSNFSATASAPVPPIQTAGAPQGMSMVSAAQMLLGGLGVWLML